MNQAPYPSPPARDLSPLTATRHDVLIIGAGINGAGLARDLAMRGLRVALVDKGDFGSGTSSASTKLVHGGLRYLEHLEFGLVFESCRERAILQNIAPHLVSPLPFLIPTYAGEGRSLVTVRAGMALYDLLALLRNTRRHRILPPAAALEAAPLLHSEGLQGAALYWDCRMDDARLCLENVLAATQAGARAGSYLQVTGLLKRGTEVRGARLCDLESGTALEVEAEVVVNATGPWLDRLCALDGEEPPKLRPTRGSHILVPRLHQGEEALYLSAGSDNRLFFVIPWGDCSLIGTTDTDDNSDPDRVTATTADIDYLLTETAAHLGTAPLSRQQVIASFSGLRPLVTAEGRAASAVSRRHRVFLSPSGMISVGGGKYTTYRAIAADLAALVSERLGRGRGRSQTARIPLPGGVTGRFAAYLQRHLPTLSTAYDLPRATVAQLLQRYGSRTPDLLQRLRHAPELAQPVIPGSPLLALEVLHAAQAEGARTPEDILRRRTSLALAPGRGLEELEAVADLLASALGTDPQRREQWLHSYRTRYLHVGKDPR